MSDRKTVLITGASGGIGYELANIFAREKCDLILVARSEQKLIELSNYFPEKYGIKATAIAADLSHPNAPRELCDRLQQESFNIDILVNNAGFGAYGLFWEIESETHLNMLQLNIVALTHLTQLVLPQMVARKSGKILNIASTAAFQPGPLMAVYYATKAYVLSFSEALANELKGSGVSVTVLCPGPTETGFQKQADREGSNPMFNQKMMDAATVARIGYRGLMKNRTIVVPGLKNQLLALFIRFMPRNLVLQIVRNMQEKK